MRVILVAAAWTAALRVAPARAQDVPPAAPSLVRNLSAPALGITESSVVLLWDDTTEPDLLQPGASLDSRQYEVFVDGTRVGSTQWRTYTASGLVPERTYSFAVGRVSDEAAPTGREEIRAATKPAGPLVNVRDFGAVGDGVALDTDAIQRAITACARGGIVIVPAGTYLVDHLDLKSDMTVEIAEGAILRFQGFKQGGRYPEVTTILNGPVGEFAHPHRSLISGVRVRNVVIRGAGTIDGNGERWWPYFPGGTDQVDGMYRPRTLLFIDSSDLLVEGVTFQDPPSWNNHLVYVDRALYSDVKFLKVSKERGRNGDGLNPDASREILIVGCLFGNQDDSIAIKSGLRGDKRPRSSEDVTIRGCRFDGKAAPGSHLLGIGIGSETSGGVRRVRVKNCTFVETASLMNVKTLRQRPHAMVEDVRVENVTYLNTTYKHARWNKGPISLDLYYGSDTFDPTLAEPLTERTPVIRDIAFRNVRIVNTTGVGLFVAGLPESPLQGVSFERVRGRSKTGADMANVGDLTMRDTAILPLP